MAKIDHHIHTSRHSPDSEISPTQLLKAAKEAGLDGVVITEHDYQWEPGELADLAREAGDLVVLSGVEVSAREGHFLVYGLPDLRDVPAGVRLKDLLTAVRRHGAAVVAAHPYRWGQDFDRIVRDHGGNPFDGVELVSNNVTHETRAMAERLLGRSTMGRTGSSDAHEPEVVGCYYTEFAGPIRSMADFVAAIKRGDGRPGHRDGYALACGPTA